MARLPRILVSLILLAAYGCGYHLSASAPITLPQGVTNIYIQNVVNPSLESWIDPYFRARFQDEFTRRAQVNWTDADSAQAYVNLTIISYDVDAELSGAQDQTLRERVTVIMEAEFRRQVDGALLWSSGPVAAFETFETGTSEVVAGERALENGIRAIADSLGADY